MKKIVITLCVICILISMPCTVLGAHEQSSNNFLTAESNQTIDAGQGKITPHAIMGKDRRKKVSSTQLETYPYTAVALLKVKYPKGTAYMSGFFLNKTTVITAGHCIYSNKDGGLATRITVYNSTGEAYDASDFEYYPEWDGGSNTNSKDYGVIKISSDETAFFKTDFTSDARNETLHCTGYPDNNTIMYTASGKAKTNGSKQFKHAIDTTPGQSGSPVYYKTNNGSYVVGIHTGGITDEYNVAVRFNRTVYDWCINYN